MIPVILGHTPAGTSTKEIIHYSQLVHSGRFQMYDYGVVENLKLYRQITPPNYPLELVEAPISLWYGENDLLANVQDVDHLYQKLRNRMGKFLIASPKWNHQDFIWGIDANKFVYFPIIEILNGI